MSHKLSSHDRRITLPPDVWASLVFYTEDEQAKIQDKITRDSVTVEKMGVETIKNHLIFMKHYPPKDKIHAPDTSFNVEEALKKKKPQSDIMIGS